MLEACPAADVEDAGSYLALASDLFAGSTSGSGGGCITLVVIWSSISSDMTPAYRNGPVAYRIMSLGWDDLSQLKTMMYPGSGTMFPSSIQMPFSLKICTCLSTPHSVPIRSTMPA